MADVKQGNKWDDAWALIEANGAVFVPDWAPELCHNRRELVDYHQARVAGAMNKRYGAGGAATRRGSFGGVEGTFAFKRGYTPPNGPHTNGFDQSAGAHASAETSH